MGSSTIDSQSSTHITLANITAISVQYFKVITPPSTRAYSIVFSTYVVASNVHYKIDQQ